MCIRVSKINKGCGDILYKCGKRRIIKRFISFAVLIALLLLGSCSEEQGELLTLEVFAGRANYQGQQKGWFAKIVRDKFNLEFNIIAPNISKGGNLLFESRLAAGKVGDIVISSYANMTECVEAGILADLTPYISKTTYLKQYLDVIKKVNERLGYGDAIYILPTSMSSMPPTEPLLYEAGPELASYIPWSYYKEIGCPVIENEDDLLNALSRMQANHPYNDKGDKVYGFSLFQDWDVGHMSLASNMVRSYGYVDTTPSVFTSADLSKTSRVMEDNSIYYRMLHLYFKANQMGLLDPESGVQNFDTMFGKAQNKQVLYLWWAWMPGNYDDGSLMERYVFVPVSTEPVVCDGFRKYGDGFAYAIGKNTRDIKRVVAFLDWMASPEGMMCQFAGLEDVGYTYVDGKPVYKEFSMDAWVNALSLNEEYGGGTYIEGYCQFNDSIVEKKDINPETGEPYHSENWTSTLMSNRGIAVQEWSAHYGADTPIEYLRNNNLIEVVISTDYVPAKESKDLEYIREKCGSLIKEYSWKMIFAESEEQFQNLWNTLKVLLYQNGYEQEEAADLKRIEEMRDRREAYIAELNQAK